MEEVVCLCSPSEERIMVLDAGNGMTLSTIRSGAVGSIAVLRSPHHADGLCGGGHFLVGALQREPAVAAYRWGHGQPLWKAHGAEPISAIAATPDGGYAIGGAASGKLAIWETGTGQLVKTVEAHYKGVTALAASSCGSYVFSAGADAVLNCWSTAELLDAEEEHPRPLRGWTDHTQAITAVRVSGARASARSFSCGLDGLVLVAEPASSAALMAVAFPSPLHCIAVDALCQELFCGAEDGHIYRLGLDATAAALAAPAAPAEGEGGAPRVLRGHRKRVTGIALADAGARVVSCCAEGAVRLWDARGGQCTSVVEACKGAAGAMLVLPRPAALFHRERGAELMPLQPFKKYRRVQAAAPAAAGGLLLPADGNAVALPVGRPADRAALDAAARAGAGAAGGARPRGADAEEVERLRAALKEAEARCERWQVVNNRLLEQRSGED